ncbi:MAG: S8 family serine peptidase [Blastocatellia bacterium]
MKLRLLAIIFFVTATLAVVHSDNRLQPGQEAGLAKIAPWVLEQTILARKAEFIVVLADQADLSGATSLKTKAEKGEYVYQALWQKAKQTQGPVIRWLKKRKIEHRAFYIVNAILVRGDRSVAVELAARPDIARVEGNPRIQNLPISEVEAASPVHATAIEGNITFVGAPDVWGLGYTGQNIVVGGADTGYRWDHTALRNQYRGTSGMTASHDFNWHDSIHAGGGSCGANSPVPCDDNGHGTHTVGTAVGDDGGVNQIGVAPGAKWIGCRNMDQGNGTPATYIECFEFFLAPYPVSGTPAQGQPSKAPDVTTNSWTCPPSEGCSALTLQAAVEAQRAAGIVTVVAAGNTAGCSTIGDPPSLYDASYTVGAFNHTTGLLAGFSSQGPVTIDGSNRLKPDITAPGVTIRSSTRTTTTAYQFLSGTSMATPHVAGAIALLLSARPDLRDNVSDLQGYLNDTATPVSTASCGAAGVPNNTWGYGRLNVKAAVDLALATIAPTSSSFSAGGGMGSGNVTAGGAASWTAVSNDVWIIINGGASGTGNGTFGYSVAPNQNPDARVGTITIARRTFTVFQAGTGSGSCSYLISPKSRIISAKGRSGTLEVGAPAGCVWSAVSNDGFIAVVSGGGIGAGTVSYTVDTNTGHARKGTITIGSQIFLILQNGN